MRYRRLSVATRLYRTPMEYSERSRTSTRDAIRKRFLSWNAFLEQLQITVLPISGFLSHMPNLVEIMMREVRWRRYCGLAQTLLCRYWISGLGKILHSRDFSMRTCVGRD